MAALEEVAKTLGTIATICGVLAAFLYRTRPGRWFRSRVLGAAWRAVVADPLAGWLYNVIAHVVRDLDGGVSLAEVARQVQELRTDVNWLLDEDKVVAVVVRREDNGDGST